MRPLSAAPEAEHDLHGRADAARASAAAGLPAESAEHRVHVQVLEAFIAQHYLDGGVPPLLVLSHAVDKALIEALSQQSGIKVTAQHQPREPRRAWLDMCLKGAALRLAQLLAEEGSQQARTRALVDALEMTPEQLDRFRIECFDISHTAGEATQASCVVFEAHKMQSAQYRRYNIEGITGGDDYAAMRQVLHRRYGKIAAALAEGALDPTADAAAAKSGLRLPDLVLIDGGKGQVSMAREVFEELGLDLGLIVGRREGRGPQGRPGRAGVCRWAREGLPRQGFGRADAGGADPRRGSPLCHHRHACQAGQCAHRRQYARGHSRCGPQEACPLAAALRRCPRRGAGQR